jgi:nucleoside phosphorylase/class 3 adenylate cyclase
MRWRTLTLTFLSTDIVSSTALWHRSAHDMSVSIARHDDILRQAIGTHNGVIISHHGDGVIAAFTTPADALDAALAAQRTLIAEHGTGDLPFRVRMALHTGEVKEHDNQYDGLTLSLTARLMSVAQGGQCLLSQTTFGLLEKALPSDVRISDIGQHSVRGFPAPIRIFQLVHPGAMSDFPPVRTLTLDSQQTTTVRFALVLATELEDLDTALLDRIVERAKELAGDLDLRVTGVKSGSVKIELVGKEEAYRVLRSLFLSGTLTDLCGLVVKDIAFLEDTKSEDEELFTHPFPVSPLWAGPIPPDEPKSLSDSCRRVIDVVLLTAVEIELDAVLRVLKPFPTERFIWRVVREGRTYYMGRFGEHDAVVTMCTMGYAGKGGAARTTAKAILGWNPKAVIMVGIAYGNNKQTQKLGDVLVSSQVAYYGIHAVRSDGTVQHRGDIVPCGDALLDRFRHTRSWTFEHPDGTKCKVRSGQVLSGPILLDNAELKAQLFKAYPYAIGGEMEAVGVYDAASELQTEWIVVKAVCDWGDGSKADNYQAVAAAAATSLAHYVLSNPYALEDLTRPNLTPPGSPHEDVTDTKPH